MVKKRLIGYGYTNGSGIATLDYTADGTDIKTLAPMGISGYIGSGGGEIDIKAELHDDDTVQSEPYNVLDCTFRDGGTSSDHNDTYFYSNAYNDFTRGDVSTSVDLTTQNGGNVVYSVGDGMVFEMDLVEVTNYCQVNVGRTQTGQSTSYHGWKYIEPCTVRVEILPSQTIFKKIVNGTSTTLQTINNSTNTDYRVYFVRQSADGNAVFKFKNFIIYPI